SRRRPGPRDDRRCGHSGADGRGRVDGVRGARPVAVPSALVLCAAGRRSPRCVGVSARHARQGPGREGRVSDPGANHRDDRGGRGMGQSPSDIRAEIEETRARVGDEVDALSYKTDVPARVVDYVDEKKRALKDKVTGAKDAITGTASDAVPSGRQIGKLRDTAERNPLGLVVGWAAIRLRRRAPIS